MRALWTMTLADLRQRVRDRSVVIYGLVVPLALMSVFNLTFGDTDDPGLEPVTVTVAAPSGDRFAEAMVGAMSGVGAFEVTVDRVAADVAVERARSGEAELAVVVPDGFTRAVMRGEDVEVAITEGQESGLEGDVLVSVVDGVLDDLRAGTVAATAAARAGVPAGRLAEVAERAAARAPEVALAQGRASSEQLSPQGAMVAGQAGLFLLFTVGFGVLGLVAEREQGTLARLRSMPMRPGLIVAAKGLVGYLLGVVSTTVLLVAGAYLFGADFGSPVVVAVLILCAVAAATSVTFMVARVARTAEQANIAQSIVALVLGIAGGAFFTVAAGGVVGQLLDLNPIAAFIRGLGIAAGGGGLGDIGTPVAVMLGFAVVALVASRLVPDRGTEL